MSIQCSTIATAPSLGKLFKIPLLVAHSQIVIPVSQDTKKGFGGSSKTSRVKKPAKQSSGDAIVQQAAVLKEGSKELRSVLKSVKKGDISIVQPQMLPPFHEWLFGDKRYLQYLVDQHAVFDALRFAVSSIQQSTVGDDADSNESTEYGEIAMAVGIFDERLGLERSKALQKDIEALSIAMGTSDEKAIELPKITTQTMAYVKYLKQLARIACSDESRKQACLQLIAHIFTIYVTHFTTGMRVGAKALDCVLVLKEARAVRFYRDYPQHVTDPLKIFIAAVNKITDYVQLQEDQEKVMDELPRAIQKTSLLLLVLAVKEQYNHGAFTPKVAAL